MKRNKLMRRKLPQELPDIDYVLSDISSGSDSSRPYSYIQSSDGDQEVEVKTKLKPKAKRNAKSVSNLRNKKNQSKWNPKPNPKPKGNQKQKVSRKSVENEAQSLFLTTTKGKISHNQQPFMKRWDGVSNYLEIFEQEYRSFPPSIAVYWREKSQYMKAVIFVQIGYFDYHVYENDAILMQELFGKNVFMYSKYLAVKFFPIQLTEVTKKLYEKGIAMRFMEEVYDPEYKRKYKIIKRVVKKIINPGMSINYEATPDDRSQRFLLSVFPNVLKEQVGVVISDTSTNSCYIQQGSFDDFRRILHKFKPVEIVIPIGKNREITKMIRQVCDPFFVELDYTKSSLTEILDWTTKTNKSSVFQCMKDDWKEFKLQPVYNQIDFVSYSCLMAVDLLSDYFKTMNVWDQLIPTSTFELSCFIKFNIEPVFDTQVYENLEIFEIKNIPNSFGEKGTLYAYLNRCKTKAGANKLRRWINTPLVDANKIIRRQDAIKELLQYDKQHLQYIQKQMETLIDFDMKTASVYHWLIKNPKELNLKGIDRTKDYQQSKNPLLVKVKKIKELLENYKYASAIIQKIGNTYKFKSSLLSQLFGQYSVDSLVQQSTQDSKPSKVNLNNQINKIADNILPDIAVQWGTNVHPRKGLFVNYDRQRQQIARLNTQLNELLEQYQVILDVPKIKYISARTRNQMQFPNKKILTNQQLKQFTITSITQKMNRYTTVETVSISDEIIERENVMDLEIAPFLNHLVNKFSKHKFVWSQFIDMLSELDVLISLAIVSSEMKISCTPQFIDFGLKIQDGIHVGLAEVAKNVVRNSISFEGQESTMLITGPNMGGKSTLLRQTCILAIIAQIGCMVPAKSYQAHIFDQIFCRIGASDRPHEGKSTFFVQMQQTRRILQKASKKSLVIIDQLGRGTSTFDGVSIAIGALKDLVDNIGCITLFSTHHSIVADEFELNPKIKNKTVDYMIKDENLEFKYQLKDGVAEKSFAFNVAKLVGIPQEIIDNAHKRSNMITKESENLRDLQIDTKKFNDMLNLYGKGKSLDGKKIKKEKEKKKEIKEQIFTAEV